MIFPLDFLTSRFSHLSFSFLSQVCVINIENVSQFSTPILFCDHAVNKRPTANESIACPGHSKCSQCCNQKKKKKKALIQRCMGKTLPQSKLECLLRLKMSHTINAGKYSLRNFKASWPFSTKYKNIHGARKKVENEEVENCFSFSLRPS